MINTIHFRRSTKVFFVIIISMIALVNCVNNSGNISSNNAENSSKKNEAEKFKMYAGSLTCAKCHQKIYEAHIQTAHYLTSQRTSEKNIKGSTIEGENNFFYSSNVRVAVEKNDNQFFQNEYINGIKKKSASIDITVGSGKRGQTFLYWDKNKLFQLPLTYFTPLHQWTNSPGFSNRVIYRRPITSRCLECHSTYVQKISNDGIEPEDFSKTNIVYGVDCEKCHGPAKEHVDFHEKNPKEKKGQFIINPNLFTRKQQLESCRLCHGGRIAKSKPSFSFQAGDNLLDYFAIDTIVKEEANIDVHGNQYGMMVASKCFKMSEMTCATCHEPHKKETGKVTTFSNRCMNCHNEAHNNFCKAKEMVGKQITKNCIDCHMPELPSKSILVLLQGKSIPSFASMRSHFISIYPEITKKSSSK